MRRASHPTELILGFFAGMIAAFFVQLPIIALLHHLGLTARYGYSFERVLPMGAMALWSRTFWGGAYGLALAWFGCYRPFGRGYVWQTTAGVASARTFIDWFPARMFYGQAWAGWHVGPLLTPLVGNVAWALATALLVMVLSLWSGTYGTRSLS